MHHDIRLNALIDLPLRKGQNLSINSYYEKVCLFKSIHHRNAWPYKIILMVLKFVIDGRTKVFNNAMHQVLNHGREKLRQRNELWYKYMYANSFWIWMGENEKTKFFNRYNERVIHEYDKISFCFSKGNGFQKKKKRYLRLFLAIIQ